MVWQFICEYESYDIFKKKQKFVAAGTATTKSGVSESIIKKKQTEKNKDLYE